MIKYLWVFLLSCVLVSCKGKENEKEIANSQVAQPTSATGVIPEYKVIDEKKNEALSKDNLDIMLTQKISQESLTAIANDLRSTRKQYNKLWIFYFIKGQADSKRPWATSHFTPNLTVNILGATDAQEGKFAKASEGIDGQIIGKWLVEDYGATLYIVFEKKGKYYVRQAFSTPGVGDGVMPDEVLKKSKLGNSDKYQMKSDLHGEYFVIGNDGLLRWYNKEGRNFATGAKK